MKEKGFSFRKRLESFRYAFNGIALLFRGEHNAWIHGSVTFCVIIAGLLLDLSDMEWIAVVIVIGGVLAMEAVNSAIELLANYVCPEHHPKIKQIKDLAAGAVLLMAIAAAITGLIVFVPKIAGLF